MSFYGKKASLASKDIVALQGLHRSKSSEDAVKVLKDLTNRYTPEEIGDLERVIKALVGSWKKDVSVQQSSKLQEISNALLTFSNKYMMQQTQNSQDDLNKSMMETVKRLKAAVIKINKMFDLNLKPLFQDVVASTAPSATNVSKALTSAEGYVMNRSTLSIKDKEAVRRMLRDAFSGDESVTGGDLDKAVKDKNFENQISTPDMAERTRAALPKDFEANLNELQSTGDLTAHEANMLRAYYEEKSLAENMGQDFHVIDALEDRYTTFVKGLSSSVKPSASLSQDEVFALRDALKDGQIDRERFNSLMEEPEKGFVDYLVYRLNDKEERGMETVRSIAKKSFVARKLTGTFLHLKLAVVADLDPTVFYKNIMDVFRNGYIDDMDSFMSQVFYKINYIPKPYHKMTDRDRKLKILKDTANFARKIMREEINTMERESRERVHSSISGVLTKLDSAINDPKLKSLASRKDLDRALESGTKLEILSDFRNFRNEVITSISKSGEGSVLQKAIELLGQATPQGEEDRQAAQERRNAADRMMARINENLMSKKSSSAVKILLRVAKLISSL